MAAVAILKSPLILRQGYGIRKHAGLDDQRKKSAPARRSRLEIQSTGTLGEKNSVSRPHSCAFLIGGVMLVAYGAVPSILGASSSLRMITDSAADKTIWLLIVGAAGAVIGLVSLLCGSRTT